MLQVSQDFIVAGLGSEMLTALTQPDSIAALTRAFRLADLTEIITNASNISGYNRTSVACMRALIRRSRHEIDISREQDASEPCLARLAVRISEVLILVAGLRCCCNALKGVVMAEACAIDTPL